MAYNDPMKAIRLTKHAVEQCGERGTTEAEVCYAVECGSREPAKYGRMLCRYNFCMTDYGKAIAMR